jgi:hypothetical protein
MLYLDRSRRRRPVPNRSGPVSQHHRHHDGGHGPDHSTVLLQCATQRGDAGACGLIAVLIRPRWTSRRSMARPPPRRAYDRRMPPGAYERSWYVLSPGTLHGPKRTRGPATRLLTVLQLREHIVGILSADGKGTCGLQAMCATRPVQAAVSPAMDGPSTTFCHPLTRCQRMDFIEFSAPNPSRRQAVPRGLAIRGPR